MAAFLIADIEVTDSVLYEDYRQGVGATIAAFGGRYLARGGATAVLEGTWSPKRCVILEFPSRAQLDAWWASPAYQPLKAIRQRCSNGNLTVVEGLP